MANKKHSWVRIDGIPGLLGRKKVEWSTFEDGTTIPTDFIKEFVRANNGFRVPRGVSQKINLIVDEYSYEAILHCSDRSSTVSDQTQICYDSNKVLRQHLITRFNRSYEYIVFEREKKKASGKKAYVVVPDQLAEYMEFYETGEPFCYLVKLVTREMIEGEEKPGISEEEWNRAQEAFVRSLQLEELERRARSAPGRRVQGSNRVTVVRDPYISELAKRRANGVCQLCELQAPFLDKHGHPFLETHHIVWLARGGDDAVENTVVLCPNCHRKMHVLDLRDDVLTLLEKAASI